VQIGNVTINAPRGSGYKMLFHWPGVLYVMHDNRSETFGEKQSGILTVVIGNGCYGGHVWRFESYAKGR